MKRLPEAEFQVMKAIWTYEPPVTSSMVMRQLSGEKSWPIQSVVSLLNRLEKKGFLRSEKNGKERCEEQYPDYPKIPYKNREEYQNWINENIKKAQDGYWEKTDGKGWSW